MTIAKPKVFWPLTVDAANNKINFRELGDVSDRVATIASATYYSMDSLLAAIKTAMDAVALASDPWTITLDDVTGLVTFLAAGGTSFTLKFTVANQPYTELGFFALDTASSGLTLTAPYQHKNGWYPHTAVKKDSRDMYEEPNSVVTVSVSGAMKSISEAVLTLREVEFHFLDKEWIFMADEGATTYVNRAMERWWRYGRGRFRYWPDATVEATYTDYVLDASVIEGGFKPERMYTGKEVYRVGPWMMRSYV